MAEGDAYSSFIRKFLNAAEDPGILTKRILVTKYLEEIGKDSLSPEEKEVFSAAVIRVFKEDYSIKSPVKKRKTVQNESKSDVKKKPKTKNGKKNVEGSDDEDAPETKQNKRKDAKRKNENDSENYDATKKRRMSSSSSSDDEEPLKPRKDKKPAKGNDDDETEERISDTTVDFTVNEPETKQNKHKDAKRKNENGSKNYDAKKKRRMSSSSSSDDEEPLKPRKDKKPAKENDDDEMEERISDTTVDFTMKEKKFSDSDSDDGVEKKEMGTKEANKSDDENNNSRSESDESEDEHKKKKLTNARSDDDEKSNSETEAENSEEEPQKKKQAKKGGSSDGKTNKRSTKSGNDDDPKILRMKKYIRLAGLRLNCVKLFENCKSVKSKVQKLQDSLEEAGLKGTPSVEKCKRLKKRRERNQEIAELDVRNILTNSEGRTRRSDRNSFQSSPRKSPKTCTDTNNKDNSIKKRFSRLKDIVDSEESDD